MSMVETAAIVGSISEDIFSYMTTGNVFVKGPVTNNEIITSSSEIIKANRKLAKIDDLMSGKVMRMNAPIGDEPRFCAAYSKVMSTLFNREYIVTNASGIATII